MYPGTSMGWLVPGYLVSDILLSCLSLNEQTATAHNEHPKRIQETSLLLLKYRMSATKKQKTTGADAPLYVTVVGGGNSTPIFAALAKTAGHSVAILTRRPKDWASEVGFVNEDVGYIDGQKEVRTSVDLITDDPSKCIPQSDMIFLAGIPVHHNESILREQVAPYLDRKKKVFIGSICA